MLIRMFHGTWNSNYYLRVAPAGMNLALNSPIFHATNLGILVC